MKRRTHFLFTNKDEEVFSLEIRKALPETVFIDGNIWETGKPPAKNSISECESTIVYIWNREIYPTLPFIQRKDGKLEGPQSGMVIMFIRSRFRDEETLLSGEIAVGVTVNRPEQEKMIDFVKKVWKILKITAPKQVAQVHPKTEEILQTEKDILVGNDAHEWCKEKAHRFLKFNNNPNIYLKPV